YRTAKAAAERCGSVAVGRIGLERLELGEDGISVKFFVVLGTPALVRTTRQIGGAGAAAGGRERFLGGEQHGAGIGFVGRGQAGLGGGALDLEVEIDL